MDENWLGYDHLKFGQCINIRINCWVVWVFFIDGSEGLTEQVSQKDSLSLTMLLNYGQSLTTRKYSLLSNCFYSGCIFTILRPEELSSSLRARFQSWKIYPGISMRKKAIVGYAFYLNWVHWATHASISQPKFQLNVQWSQWF